MSQTRLSRLVLAATLPTLLAACSIKNADLGLGKVVGDMMGRSMTCAFGTMFDALSPSVAIELEAVEFHYITQMVFDRNATTVPLFWQKLDADEVTRVRALVATAYDELPSKDQLRDHPVEFYQDLLAQTMLDVIRENKQLSKFRGSRGMDIGGVHKNYSVTINLLNAGTPAVKTYATCN